jgi:hypothetical protein
MSDSFGKRGNGGSFMIGSWMGAVMKYSIRSSQNHQAGQNEE